jgi:hypothetical protein
MADYRGHERLLPIILSTNGNALPLAGKKLPPLPPPPASTPFSGVSMLPMRHPRKLARLLLISDWITRKETPSGVRTAGDAKLLERI